MSPGHVEHLSLGATSHRPSENALETARRIAAPVGAAGGAFMLHPEVLQPGKDAGYPGGFSYYVVGRGGVLGDVEANVVVSAFGFFAPALVQSLWNSGVVVEGPRAGADRYATSCAAWGRARLNDFGGVEELDSLLVRVIDSADPTGLSLFAGWQVQTRASDVPGRCYQLIHVLRELRGSCHIVAVVAHGMSPLSAIIANPGSAGVAEAERFGWKGPFPDKESLVSTFASAEALTDQQMARHLDVLSPVELERFARLLEEAKVTIIGS
ncbi:MAG: SCO6745 family protein [Actinomycetota bacterium]